MTEARSTSPRRRLKAEDRRRQIVAATVARLATRGPEEWTLRQVARDVGVAPSLITYFYTSWSGLLISAYRLLAERHDAEAARIASAGLDGRARLAAIVDLYVGEEVARDESSGAHIALWALSRREPQLRREMARFSESSAVVVREALEAHARELGIERDVGAAARTLYVLLEGLWYEMTVNPDYMTLAEGRAMVWDFIDHALAA